MATSDSTHPSPPLPEHLDLVRRYCPGLSLHTHAEVATLIAMDTGTGCWLWPGMRSQQGYGTLLTVPTDYGYQGTVPAHRYLYDVLVGAFDERCDIHHRCGVKACWNPFHLEAVTPKEHSARHHHRSRPWQPPVQLDFAFVR
jgi:hypothetical protein